MRHPLRDASDPVAGHIDDPVLAGLQGAVLAMLAEVERRYYLADRELETLCTLLDKMIEREQAIRGCDG